MPDKRLLSISPMRGSAWTAGVISRDRRTLQVGDYPFLGFVERQAAQLLRLALGPGVQNGGAVLITGRRGSGKTSAVNKAIYDCGLLGRGLPLLNDTTGDGHRDREVFAALDTLALHHQPMALSIRQRDIRKSWRMDDWRPTLVLTVPINLSSPITADALTRRLVRQLYWSLANSGLAGLAPELVQQARMACLRTAARFKDLEDEQLKKSFSSSLQVSAGDKHTLAVEAGASAHEELMIARRLALEFDISTKEEMEEQMLQLLEAVDGTVFGRQPGLWERLGTVVEWYGEWLAGLDKLHGDRGLKVNVVFVLDELDKLEFSPDEPPEQAHSTIRDIRGMAEAIKPLLTSGRASFVVVSGEQDAHRWLQESRGDSDLLGSVFSSHFHFGLLTQTEVSALCRGRLQGLDQQPAALQPLFGAWLRFQADGVFKKAISALRRLRFEDRGAAELLADWRTCDTEGRELARALLVQVAADALRQALGRGARTDASAMQVIWDDLDQHLFHLVRGRRPLEPILDALAEAQRPLGLDLLGLEGLFRVTVVLTEAITRMEGLSLPPPHEVMAGLSDESLYPLAERLHEQVDAHLRALQPPAEAAP